MAQPGPFTESATVVESPDVDVPILLQRLTGSLQSRWSNALRLLSTEQELRTLRTHVWELQHGYTTVVPVDTLAPEPLILVRPFRVTVERHEDEYRASFVDANLSAFGETRNEALWALKDLIAATFEMLSDLGEARLGPGPARQLQVLREFIRKP